MKENFYIQLFEGKQVRIVWDAKKISELQGHKKDC